MPTPPDQAPVPQIFDRKATAAKWARARDRRKALDSASYVYSTIEEDLADRLDFMRAQPENALLIGGELEGMRSASVMELGKFDEEVPYGYEEFDLVAHIVGLGAVNDLPGALIHARNSLKPDGLFMASFPGAGSLPVLRSIVLQADNERPAARMHPLVDSRAGTALLERAGFSRKVVDTYPIKVRFSSLSQLVSDLRDQGLTRSLVSRVPALSRAWLSRAQSAFDEMREEDGKVTETFEILVLTGWR